MKTIAEFAAERRDDQTAMEKDLFPDVSEALQVYPATNWYMDLLAEVTRLYVDTYHRAGGQGRPPGVDAFIRDVRNTLDKTQDPTDATADRISVWLSTAILNAANQEVVGTETAGMMQWVTMHDSAVREAHADTDGQRRVVGEPFDVAGVEMRYPGDPTAPIELWINCRCALAPTASVGADFALEEGVTMTATETETEAVVDVAPLAWHGVLAPEGEWSGDGRQFAPDSLRFRDLPLPLTWQKATNVGHDGSVVVGRIDTIERVDGMMQATGVFLMTPEADEVVGLLAEFGKFGVSVDADDAEFEFSEADDRVTFTSARIASASIVSIPAFSQAYIALGQWADMGDPAEPKKDVCNPDSPDYDQVACDAQSSDDQPYAVSPNEFADLAPGVTEDGPGWLTHPIDTDRLRDYWTHGEGAAKIAWGTDGDFNRCRVNLSKYVKPEYLNGYCANRHFDALGFWPGQHSATTNTWSTTVTYNGNYTTGTALTLVSGGGPKAPAAWFTNPNLSGPTHFTVTEEGRVYGHIAEWSACHIGYDGVCVAPPFSSSDYAYYATGKVLLDNGTAASTGVISLGGGHARDGLRPRAAVAHYDSTSAAVADVMVGEDAHGIWCAGWVRPGATDEQIVALRASDVSGDWREVRPGQMEMVAALAVNVGGFPTVSVGVRDGVQVSLVAAGAVRSHDDDVIEELAARIEGALVARESRRVRMQELASRWERRERMKALAARVERGN